MTGRLFDRRGADAVMYPSFIFLTLGLFLLSITGNSLMLLISGCFVGLGYGTFMSNGQAVCLKEVDSHRIGVALSTYFIGLDLGLGVGPYALGSLKGMFNYSQIYIICGVIPVVVIVLYKFFYKTKSRRKRRYFRTFERRIKTRSVGIMDSNQLILEALKNLVNNVNELNKEIHSMEEVNQRLTIEQVEIAHELKNIKRVLINDNIIG